MADLSFDEQMKLAMAASLKDHKEEKPKETLQPLSGLVDLFDKAAEIKHRLSEHWVATETDFWYYNCKDEIDRGWVGNRLLPSPSFIYTATLVPMYESLGLSRPRMIFPHILSSSHVNLTLRAAPTV
eukprot:1316071-Amorphochlora_amoeboformis.AAC.1